MKNQKGNNRFLKSFGEIKSAVKNKTKVLLLEVRWKSIVLFFIISGIVIILMIIAGMIYHDYGLMQWEALRRHSYWIVPLGVLCFVMSNFRLKHKGHKERREKRQ